MYRRLLLLIVAMSAISCRPNDEAASDATESSNAAKAEIPEVPKAAEIDWAAEYERMTSALELSEDEEAALRSAFQAREQAVADWMQSTGAQLTQLEREMAAAAKDRDLREVQRTTMEARPLRDELRTLIESHQAAILAALSPANRLDWAAYELAERLLNLMEPLDLTPLQVEKIRDESRSAVQASSEESNPSAAGFLKLEQTVEADVLAEDQRREFAAIKQKNPMRSLK